ncbi:hypothetical protein RDABS01_000823 [Bienertia sinuspersici]
MVDELSDKWKKTSLIDAEEEALVWDDEPDGLMDELVAHSLAPKLITESPFNSEVLKNIMKNLWKPTKGLVAREIKNNNFIFQFFSKLDREKVMDQGTWSFDAYQFPARKRKKTMAMTNKIWQFIQFGHGARECELYDGRFLRALTHMGIVLELHQREIDFTMILEKHKWNCLRILRST